MKSALTRSMVRTSADHISHEMPVVGRAARILIRMGEGTACQDAASGNVDANRRYVLPLVTRARCQAAVGRSGLR
jgi:hypothetical protein